MTEVLMPSDPAMAKFRPHRKAEIFCLADPQGENCWHSEEPRNVMQPPNRNKVAADWRERGFSCELWVDPPGQCWENFTHATDELVIVLDGEMEFEVEGRAHHPKIGEELLIPAKAVHSARNIGKTTSRWLYGYMGTTA